MLKQEWSIIKKISVGFFISSGIEVLQFVLAIGATDITDLIGNTLGGIVGIGVFYLYGMHLRPLLNHLKGKEFDNDKLTDANITYKEWINSCIL